jgi:hypothetical protein
MVALHYSPYSLVCSLLGLQLRRLCVRGNYLSAFVLGRAIKVTTCPLNQLSYTKSLPVSLSLKMNFEDVEERDGAYYMLPSMGGRIS